MAAAVYLEQYLDSLESLPMELQRNFSLMRDLDRRGQEHLKETEKHADTFLASVNKISADDKKRRHQKMEQMFSKLTEYGDGKVQLAFQTYEMVDKHIRKLDNDLARFEAELNDKNLPVENSTARAEKGASKRRSKKKEPEESASKGTKRKKKETAKEPSAVLQPPSPDVNAPPSDVLDMPVDPNEPTYCICHQVSYGEMIGCDNLDCPIEWFHFQCVNLTSKPKGKWYCPRCTEQRRRR